MGRPVLFIDDNGFIRDTESGHQLLIKFLIISDKNIKKKNVIIKPLSYFISKFTL